MEVDWNSDKKCSASVDFGIEPNIAVMFLHDDVVADGESLAGSLADLLGGEERLEDAGAGGKRNAGAVVFDFDLNIVVDLASADGELSAFARLLDGSIADGVGSIDDEIEKDLIHFIGVALDAGRSG